MNLSEHSVDKELFSGMKCKKIRIIDNHYGVVFIIINTINNKIGIQDNKRLKC